ncbi:MAG: Uma2 family endonuclease [Chloroflexi bacterium]|nr:Uma2 family endonuclease [Chloroflexota bacterium]
MTDVLQPSATDEITSTSSPGMPDSAGVSAAADWPGGIPRHMTLEEFLTWDHEGLRAEWVDGDVVVMSPAQAVHQRIIFFLARMIAEYCEQHDLGEVFIAGMRLLLASRPSGRDPDIMFLTTAHLDRVDGAFVHGPADLVIEVVSPESEERDRATKFLEYEAAGIPEYWLVDPLRQDVIFHELGADGHYHPGTISADGIYTSQALEGFRLKVDWLWREPLPTPSAARVELPR